MRDLSNLLLLLVLGAAVGLWLKLTAARELAVREARRQCEQHGLQLLDETVGLRSVRLPRIQGRRVIERCYGFEVSIDGDDREPGRLWMIGSALSGLSLPTIELAPAREKTSLTALPGAADNVVVLQSRRRDRLN
jgi:hypothetical protein